MRKGLFKNVLLSEAMPKVIDGGCLVCVTLCVHAGLHVFVFLRKTQTNILCEAACVRENILE